MNEIFCKGKNKKGKMKEEKYVKQNELPNRILRDNRNMLLLR